MSYFDNIVDDKKSSVKVAIRIRPLNERETKTRNIINIQNNMIIITNPQDRKSKKFTYDYLYDTNTTQEKIYDDIGQKVIKNIFNGYNGCVFAYGLTGCFEKGTPIMMYDGKYKTVENIKLNDKIMGDDSTVRNVRFLFKGVQKMYEISSNSKGFDSYTVKEDHFLVLKISSKPNIKWCKNKWVVIWFNTELLNVHNKSFIPIKQNISEIVKSKNNALQFINNLENKNRIIEIPVNRFIKIPKCEKYYYECITNRVEFSSKV